MLYPAIESLSAVDVRKLVLGVEDVWPDGGLRLAPAAARQHHGAGEEGGLAVADNSTFDGQR